MTRILWTAAGRPTGDGDIRGICRVCGELGTGLPFNDWARPTFTDWDKLMSGDILCHACQFAFRERSELLARRVGKEKPQRMRNYSHFVIGGEWRPLSKAEKARMAHVILYEDWRIAIIARSGQKHLIFRAAPGAVQFEEQRVPDVTRLGALLAVVEALYDGFSKAEIGAGDYAQHRVLEFGPARWWELEQQIKPMRQSALFELALFLAQRKD